MKKNAIRINYKSNVPFEIRWDFLNYDNYQIPYMKFNKSKKFENYELLISKVKCTNFNFFDNNSGDILTEIEGAEILNKEEKVNFIDEEIILKEIHFYFNSFETMEFEFNLNFLEFFKEDEFLDIINQYHKTNIGYKKEYYENLEDNINNKYKRKKLKRPNDEDIIDLEDKEIKNKIKK